jgi:hypothetical protein
MGVGSLSKSQERHRIARESARVTKAGCRMQVAYELDA